MDCRVIGWSNCKVTLVMDVGGNRKFYHKIIEAVNDVIFDITALPDKYCFGVYESCSFKCNKIIDSLARAGLIEYMAEIINSKKILNVVDDVYDSLYRVCIRIWEDILTYVNISIDAAMTIKDILDGKSKMELLYLVGDVVPIVSKMDSEAVYFLGIYVCRYPKSEIAERCLKFLEAVKNVNR